MDTIIENDLNAAFLEEARQLGYKTYVNTLKAADDRTTPGFYLGSVQRCIRDDVGKRYFIDIDMYNLGAIGANLPRQFSATASVQFHIRDSHERVTDITLSHESFDDTESFFDAVWRKMRFGYYERS